MYNALLKSFCDWNLQNFYRLTFLCFFCKISCKDCLDDPAKITHRIFLKYVQTKRKTGNVDCFTSRLKTYFWNLEKGNEGEVDGFMHCHCLSRDDVNLIQCYWSKITTHTTSVRYAGALGGQCKIRNNLIQMITFKWCNEKEVIPSQTVSKVLL